MSFLELPFSARYHVMNGLSVSAGLGPVFMLDRSYRTKAALTTTDPNGGQTTDVDEGEVSSTEGMASIALDLNVGLQYELKNKLNFGARYIHDITDLNNDDLVSDHFGMVELSVGYTLFGKPREP